MSYRNVGSSCPHYRERRRSPHRTDSDALYAVGGGNTGPASSVTTNFTPYYLDKKHRREDTPVSYFSRKCWDFLWIFYFYRYFSVPYFGLACDHGNSFLCLEEEEREGYWIEVRTVFNVKTTTTDDIRHDSSE